MSLQQRHISMQQRLERMSLVVVFIFALISFSLYLTSLSVRSDMDSIVTSTNQKVIRNSQINRDLGLLNTKLSVFTSTFYIDDKWYEKEKEELKTEFSRLQAKTQGTGIENVLKKLQERFTVYLQRRKWVNYLLFWRAEQDQDINEIFLLLKEIIAEKMVNTTLNGGNIDYLEQLIALLSGYRESSYEIAKINAEENPAHLLTLDSSSTIPLTEKLDSLIERLGTLTASEPPIDRLGQHLIDRFIYYKFLMRQYHEEMIRLGELTRDMDQLTIQNISVLAQLDRQVAGSMNTAKVEIEDTILVAAVSFFTLLLLLAVMSWFSLRTLFRKHIQTPIAQINARLKEFQQGDHFSPMKLGRSDEWGKIEDGFNGMVAELQEGANALKQSEQHYRDIYSNISEGIYRSSLSGRFVSLNPAAVAILGCDSEADCIAKYADLEKELYTDPQDRHQLLKLLQTEGKVSNYEVQMRRKNGEIFWASLNTYVVYDENNRALGVEGIIADVTERKLAQRDLQGLQQYLQNIIDSMPTILIGVDPDMNVVRWNLRAETESELSAKGATGLFISDACRLFKPEVFLPILQETLQTKEPRRIQKVECLKKLADGSPRFFDILVYPLVLAGQGGAVLHVEEITERVHLEEMLVRSEKMQAIGGLAAGLAHEINNPLAVILQNIQVLNRRLSPELEANRKTAQDLGTTIEVIGEYMRLRGCEKMLHSVLHAGQRVAKIVENIQSFSRRGQSSFIPCSLSELLEKTVELSASDFDMRHQFDFRTIQIIRDYQTIPNVSCDGSQIQQVILSLLKNAAQALCQNVDNPQIILRLFSSGNESVVLQIEDNGPGMSAEVVERIFDPFYTRQNVGQGTGLGLSIAYFIVAHSHHGQLLVTSVPGQGSCFEMILPIENKGDA